MNENKNNTNDNGGFVRADQIDLKSLDEQLERHLSRAWTMEKKQEKTTGVRRLCHRRRYSAV
ncbi:hypothetical protein Hdeb2414_s0523g00910541 [Helianthus debilis subsp. tardiflorus]